MTTPKRRLQGARTWIVVVVILFVGVHAARAADAYFVRFSATGRSNSAAQTDWIDDVLFFNPGPNPATVRLLGISNGSLPADAPGELLLAVGHVISLNHELQGKWSPIPSTPEWVLHLDVPAGILAESRDEFFVHFTSTLLVPSLPAGKVSMPVFRDLTPANKPQIHLGTDLSGNESRVNVGIYNAATETATASIELRRTCDDALIASRTVTISPNTIVQVGGFSTGDTAVCNSANTPDWTRYTIVMVSQPSITYVANLNEVVPPPGASGLVPPVGLAVTRTQQF